MEIYELLQLHYSYLTHLIAFFGIAIIFWGFLIALKDLLLFEFSQIRHKVSPRGLRYIRINFGGYILFGLEFLIASDIIASILSRSVEDLYYLVVIVIVRTIISYFLGREIAELPERK